MLPCSYQLAGLRIAATRPLPGLPAGPAQPQVDLEVHILGQQPRATLLDWQDWVPWGSDDPSLLCATDTRGDWFCFAYSFDQLLPGAFVTFVIGPGGRQIWAEWNNPTVDEPTALSYLAGTLNGRILAYALRLQGRLALHASVVAVDDRALLLMGEPGAGKTTLASVLGVSGYPIVADDVAFLNDTGGQWQIWPALQQMRLTAESLALFGAPAARLACPLPFEQKHLLPASQLPGARSWDITTPLTPGAVYLLGPRTSGDLPCFTLLDPAASLKTLLDQRYGIAGPSPRLLASELPRLSRLARQLPVTRLQLPHNLARLPALATLVVEHARLSVRRGTA